MPSEIATSFQNIFIEPVYNKHNFTRTCGFCVVPFSRHKCHIRGKCYLASSAYMSSQMTMTE